ncbi:MAG: hypothetical protein KatS3mg077_0756 [Candidatus Binatia bacterium]|nr:MAG: hypothetical protein KatS3mg077_0756 [Candidatus Binatia bacterium]
MVRIRQVAWALACVGGLWASAGCRESVPQNPPLASASGSRPRIPEGEAGRVLEKAIAAAGGWRAWQALKDVTFVSTLTIFDSRGEATSETIFLHKQPLHRGPLIRMESIGLREEVLFGYDGRHSWMFRGGRWVDHPQEKMFTEFHGISSVLSFGLPFVLAEMEGLTLAYAGQEGDEDQRWEKLRVVYADELRSPIRWAILYFDADSGLLDHVYAQVEAPFLQHPTWLGRWREYREVAGVRQERVRSFYPADPGGVPVAGLAAEQLIEHVQFNVGLPASLFQLPLRTEGGSLTWDRQRKAASVPG